MSVESSEDEVLQYGDENIASKNAPVPKWLIWSYIIISIWGIVCWHLYWNGSFGWLDPGYWGELQTVANTTLPTPNYDNPISNIKQ